MATLYQLPPLPYDYTALEPYIDATTMNVHHKGHHQTYVNNLNAALEKAPTLKTLSLPDLLAAVGTPTVPSEVATAVRNNGGGHWNHSFFWKIMAPPGTENGASPELASAIDASFGSMDEMKTQFNKAAASVFGSGWAWLAVKPGDGMVITTTPNQDNPLMTVVPGERVLPVLGIDCWEHAYYLKYLNRRPEYIAAWWNVVNLPQASANYAEALAGKPPSAL